MTPTGSKVTNLVRVEFGAEEDPDYNGAVVLTDVEARDPKLIYQRCQDHYSSWAKVRSPAPMTKEQALAVDEVELARVLDLKAELEARIAEAKGV